ncbi:MAG: nicotinamidase [Alphaproteobacteria bacterium]|nr:nicotinamidase [Alphaproteobacteria bacterium]
MRPSPPRFYDPAQVGTLFMERSAMVAEEAARFRDAANITPAGQDKLRIAAFGIDCQVGFCTPGASLFVPGAVEDTRRAVEWIYRNLDRLTGLHFSMDTHRVFQIFHPAWWTNPEGEHPDPLTPITHEDVRKGRWIPIAHPKACLEYTAKLEASGKYVLTIWPYHTLLGGLSHALEPTLMEAALFHAVARRRQTHFETKGTHAMTENYSVLAPEVTELSGQAVGGFNAPFFRMLMEYDRIYIFGQAKSHCVLSTLQDIRDHVQATDPGLADRVYILEDAMSPVPAPPLDPLPPALDFPRIADEAIEEFRAAGMHIVTTADPIDA